MRAMCDDVGGTVGREPGSRNEHPSNQVAFDGRRPRMKPVETGREVRAAKGEHETHPAC